LILQFFDFCLDGGQEIEGGGRTDPTSILRFFDFSIYVLTGSNTTYNVITEHGRLTRQKLCSLAHAHAMACSFVSSAHCLVYLKKADCKEDLPLTLPLCTACLLLTVESSGVN
jgi:hypothetical protein